MAVVCQPNDPLVELGDNKAPKIVHRGRLAGAGSAVAATKTRSSINGTQALQGCFLRVAEEV